MVDPKLARAYGTLAGFGFIGVALLTLPSTRLLDPQPAPEAYLLTLLGVVTGLICIAVPWDGRDPRWLHLIGVAATAEAAATVAVFGQPYVAFFFLIAVLVAYVSPDVRTIGIQLGLICLAMLGPVVYGPEDARSSLNVGLVAIPVLLLTASLFSYLRLKMVNDRRAYHRFAEQTLVLSDQIAGRPLGPVRLAPQYEPVPRISRVRPPAALLAGCAVLLGVPLFAGGLAAAGVKLPDLANDSFERVGIELPNQDPEAPTPVPATEQNEVGKAAPGGAEHPAAGHRRPSKPGADKSPGSGGADPAGSASGAEPTTAPTPTAEPAPAGSDPLPPNAAPPPDSGPITSPLNDLLDEATQGLQGLVDQPGGKK